MAAADMDRLPGYNSFRFLTDAEKAERHKLILAMPSSGERMQAAQKRLQQRIKQRNQ